MAIKETKAQRIFRKSFCEAKRYIETWGFDNFDAWHSLYEFTNNNELICRRTINAILKECDKGEKFTALFEKNGIIGEHEAAVERKAFEVVRNTCKNWIVREAELKAI